MGGDRNMNTVTMDLDRYDDLQTDIVELQQINRVKGITINELELRVSHYEELVKKLAILNIKQDYELVNGELKRKYSSNLEYYLKSEAELYEIDYEELKEKLTETLKGETENE